MWYLQVVQTLLACMCQVLLSLFYDLQDALLAITWIRRLMTYSLAPSCRDAILRGLMTPQSNPYAVLSFFPQFFLRKFRTSFSAHDSSSYLTLPSY